MREQRTYTPLLISSVILGLVGLPVATWVDLRDLSEGMLRSQAGEISRIIDDMRAFYGSDVVGRVLQSDGGRVSTVHNYKDVPGAIPIPATLSIELGKRISAHQGQVKYRFVSELPFKGRDPHELDTFERAAISKLRDDPKAPVVEISGSFLNRQVRAAAPIIMGPVCVQCHNTHPDSPKTDWKVGDRSRNSTNLDRSQRPVVQVPSGVFRARGRRRPLIHPHAAAPGASGRKHESGA